MGRRRRAALYPCAQRRAGATGTTAAAPSACQALRAPAHLPICTRPSGRTGAKAAQKPGLSDTDLGSKEPAAAAAAAAAAVAAAAAAAQPRRRAGERGPAAAKRKRERIG